MSKRQKSREGQDYISNLPDYIIGHTLSFLSTKDAVRTCVLSKRWKYMWTFVTKLDFSDGENYSNDKINKFSNFVCRVMFLINSESIQNFKLCIGEKYDAYYINKWLSVVLNKGVKNICVVSFNSLHLSSCTLFQSTSLETLVLRMIGYSFIKVPTFVCLPSLTVLNLGNILFTHYSSDKLKELTLKLPLLRTYKTSKCVWLGVKSVTLEAPLLEEVIIKHSITRHKFCSSHLTKFVYRGYISLLPETILVGAHITSADIFLNNDSSVEETWVSLRNLLSLFTNTECLELHFNDLQCLTRVEHHLAGNPAFGMLGHMRLNSVTGEVLLWLLLKSPCLKTLVLQMDNSDKEIQNFAIVPDCFQSTLKVVKMEPFSGGECELSFAKFVMENARVLQSISFSFDKKLSSSEVEKAKEKLLLFDKSAKVKRKCGRN